MSERIQIITEPLGRVLYIEHEGTLFYAMDDGPLHRQWIEAFASSCSGAVLCLGLGLGVICEYLSQNPAVTQIDVVEIDADVIAEIDAFGANIVQADALSFVPAQTYDFIYHDICSDYNAETLALTYSECNRLASYCTGSQHSLLFDYENRELNSG